MSVRAIVKRIFPETTWPYLRIPYHMCRELWFGTKRTFIHPKIVAKARKYIPYYQDDLSLRALNDRLDYILRLDDNTFALRAKSEGWKFHELYEIPRGKYSCITVVCGRNANEPYIRNTFELLVSAPKHKIITLKDFIEGYSPDASELLVLLLGNVEILSAQRYIDRKGITNDIMKGLFSIREEDQYVDVFEPVENEVIVDAGAYVGDTALRFVKYTEGGGGLKLRRIYSFEPEPENAAAYRENLKAFADKVTLVQAGTWDKEETLNMFSNGAGSAVVEEGTTQIQLTTIDKVVGDDKVTFIKMDVEGAELKSLIGARETILKNHPRLAICVYHKPEDIYTIPEYLLSLVPEYRFYLRHYSTNHYETVLYAHVPN